MSEMDVLKELAEWERIVEDQQLRFMSKFGKTYDFPLLIRWTIDTIERQEKEIRGLKKTPEHFGCYHCRPKHIATGPDRGSMFLQEHSRKQCRWFYSPGYLREFGGW